VDDGLREHGGGGGAVAGQFAGPDGNGANHFGSHVFERLGKFNGFGDSDAILADARAAEALLNQNIASLRAERRLDRVGQDIDTALSGDVRKSSLDDTRKGPPDDVAGVKDGRHGDNFSFL
jgi:hypothetical protein